MKNRHNRAQTQCPSCGAWNDSNASMCTGCGRILQVQAKPPVDYRRLMPLILVAVAAFAAVYFGGIYNSLYMMHKGRLQIRIMKRRQMS